jgi:hypothetical protein
VKEIKVYLEPEVRDDYTSELGMSVSSWIRKVVHAEPFPSLTGGVFYVKNN